MLKIEDLNFSFEKKTIFSDFSLSVKTGETVAVMGDSGCGKTTLLRLIAGLEKPQQGTISCNAKRIAYVFQEPRLFPWLTVAENLRTVLTDREDTDQSVLHALETVGLAENANSYPDELSGGMKIRVSLARALVSGGDLFLLDEPFSALNEELRHGLAETLKKIFKKRGITAILVTHQASDAEILADRIVRIE